MEIYLLTTMLTIKKYYCQELNLTTEKMDNHEKFVYQMIYGRQNISPNQTVTKGCSTRAVNEPFVFRILTYLPIT